MGFKSQARKGREDKRESRPKPRAKRSPEFASGEQEWGGRVGIFSKILSFFRFRIIGIRTEINGERHVFRGDPQAFIGRGNGTMKSPNFHYKHHIYLLLKMLY